MIIWLTRMAVMFCIAKVWERNGGIVKTKNKSMNQAFSVTKNGMNPAYGISLIFPQLAIVTVGHSKMPERPHWKANIHTALGCPRQSWTLFLLLHQHKEAPVWTCNDSQCDLLIRVHGNYFFFLTTLALSKDISFCFPGPSCRTCSSCTQLEVLTHL